MPRIKAKKRDYAITDFSAWLYGEIKKQGVKQIEIAEWFNITPQAVSQKIKNGTFSLKELIILFEKMDVPEEKIGKLLKV